MTEDYYEKHQCCPMCGSKSIAQTLVDYLGDKNLNIAGCVCGFEGTVDDLVPESKYEYSLIDTILDRKEAHEKLEEEEKAKKLSEATHDETDPRFWSVETTAQYIIWIFQKKSPHEIERIMDVILDKLKG